MKQQHRKGISIFTSQLTATLSVAMVLVLLGLIALTAIGARNVSDAIRSNVGFDVVLADTVSDRRVTAIQRAFADAPYVTQVHYRSSDDALEQWRRDTGEDLIKILGINPFSNEIEVKVRPSYASSDSLTAIVAQIETMTGIKEVAVNSSMIDDINRNIGAVFMVLGIVAAVLLAISLALINNTVHLDIYSRRFLIHTMTLVGATPGFIRRPFLISNMISGLIAGLIAAAILAGGVAVMESGDEPLLAGIVPWSMSVWVMAGVVAVGVLICLSASAFSTTRYLRSSYDDMFK